jgi:hypothetical protein
MEGHYRIRNKRTSAFRDVCSLLSGYASHRRLKSWLHLLMGIPSMSQREESQLADARMVAERMDGRRSV